MHENSENISSALNHAASSKAISAAGASTTITAFGVIETAKNPDALGSWMATNGIGFLSWAEICTIIGSIYVTYQLIKVSIIGFKKTIVFAKKMSATYYKWRNKLQIRRIINAKHKDAR